MAGDISAQLLSLTPSDETVYTDITKLDTVLLGAVSSFVVFRVI